MKKSGFIRTFIKDWHNVVLLLLSILFVGSTVHYALRSYLYPQWDEQHYMYMAAGFYRLFLHPTLSLPYDMLQLVPVRQPGYPLMILPFLLVFGISHAYVWGQVTNSLLLVATMWGIYFLARNYMSRLAAFLAAFLFMCYGWTIFFAHLTYSETATSAVCLFTILFLVKADLFRNRKYSILFAVFLAISILTRWICLVFFAGPFLYVGYQMIRQNLFTNKKVLITICIVAAVSILLAIYPYIVNFYWYFDVYFAGHRVGGPMWQTLQSNEKALISIRSVVYYINTLAQLGIVFFLLIVAGLLLSIQKKSNLKIFFWLIFCAWIFFAFFSILKDDRFVLPIYPYLAILSGAVFDVVKQKKIKAALIAIVVILSLGQFLGGMWGKGPMKKNLQYISVPLPFHARIPIYLTSVSRPPYIYRISGKEIVDYLENDSKKHHISNPYVLTLFYRQDLNDPIMSENLYNQVKPLNMITFLGTVIPNPTPHNVKPNVKLALKSNYLLLKTGTVTDNTFTPNNYIVLKAFIQLFHTEPSLFTYFQKQTTFWIYQDSTQVTVYRRIKPVPQPVMSTLLQKLSHILMTEQTATPSAK